MKVDRVYWIEDTGFTDIPFGYPAYRATWNVDGKLSNYTKVYNENSHSDELDSRFKKEAVEAFNRKRLINE